MELSKTAMGKIYSKTQGNCAYCGCSLDPFGDWHIEHAIPKSRDGSDHIDNLFPSCDACNRMKKSKTPEEFRDWFMVKLEKDVRKIRERLEHFILIKEFQPLAQQLRHIEQIIPTINFQFYHNGTVELDGV